MIDELATTEQGETRPITRLRPGDFIWHQGAFRRVIAIRDARTVTMAGQHVLRSTHASTVEAATRRMILAEQRARNISGAHTRRLRS